jgi:hypothetical protein
MSPRCLSIADSKRRARRLEPLTSVERYNEDTSVIINLILLDRRAVRRASLAIFGLTLVTACDTDRPTSPAAAKPAAEVPTSANGLVTPVGNLVFATVSSSNQFVGPATFTVTGPWRYLAVVTDNSGQDIDPALGKLRLASLAQGLYKVCETKAPPEHVLADSACHSGMVYGGNTTAVATFKHQWLPLVEVSYKDLKGVLVGGGGFTVKDTLGNTLKYIGDDGVDDVNKVPGKFYFRLPVSGKVSICGTHTPGGYSLPFGYAVCLTSTYANGTMTWLTAFPVVPAPSIGWGNRNIYEETIPGGTFHISNPVAGVSMLVSDNDPNDLDAAPGKMLVKVGKAIWYNVCEVTPPNNYFMANPACRTVDVTSGKSVWAAWFYHQEKAVVYNP